MVAVGIIGAVYVLALVLSGDGELVRAAVDAHGTGVVLVRDAALAEWIGAFAGGVHAVGGVFVRDQVAGAG